MVTDNYRQISRRHFIASTGMLAAGLWLSPKSLLAQEESPVFAIKRAASAAKITVTKLRNNICLLEGAGGNIAVLSGNDGKLMVDSGIDVAGPHVMAALNSINPDPVKHLLNTHWHFDHTGGNTWLRKTGATITAQDITRKHMKSTIRQEDWHFTFKPAPPDALPSILYKNRLVLHINAETIHIKTYEPAHTDGDSSVYFEDADVLHVADTFWNSYYPMIDYSSGGNIDGMVRAAQKNIDMATDKTIVIPGHGALGNKDHLIAYHEMLITIRENVARLKRQGNSLKETIAAKPTAAYDSKWGAFLITGDFFTMLVYKGV